MMDESFDSTPRATLRIAGDTLDPVAIESMLGVASDEGGRKGERNSRGGVMSTGMWSITSEGHVTSDDLDVHIAWLLNRVDGSVDELVELGRVFELDFYCLYWGEGSAGDGPVIRPSTMVRIGAMNASLFVAFGCLSDHP